ncbi:serine/threonine protein kinase [Methanoregula sp.]|uniref:serine/threonine protein kinase n=1 Tax=Methanoregula sp. TaxID=2052170 RepID=UPI003C7751AE
MLRPGDRIGEYTISEFLGRGGFSQVYKAGDPDGTPVILKIPDISVLGDLATFARFRREAAIRQSLDHPAIPRVIAVNEGADTISLVLEYVEGTSFRTYISGHAPLPLDQVLSFTGQLADVLDYIHSHGVYHRDLKPENIIVGTDGRIHLLDFGTALQEGSWRVTWRWGSYAVGTVDYMAPEQIQGKRGDSRTDLYALGMIVYEMLTGTLPFTGDNTFSIMNQHLTAVPIPPGRFQPSVPPGIEAVVLRSICRDPALRYQSAGAFRYDMEHSAELDLSQFHAEPVAGGSLTGRRVWLRRISIFIASLAVATLLFMVVYLIEHR